MLCPQKEQGKTTIDSRPPELSFADMREYACDTYSEQLNLKWQERLHLFTLLLTSAHKKDPLSTSSRKEDGKRNGQSEFKFWHREGRGGDAAENSQERPKPPEVPWMLQDRMSSQATCNAWTWGSEHGSQLTFLFATSRRGLPCA